MTVCLLSWVARSAPPYRLLTEPRDSSRIGLLAPRVAEHALNRASADVFSGQLSLLGATPTDSGTVDAAPSTGGQFLYVQTGGTGTVEEFQVGPGGSLAPVGSVLVPGAVGGEGIVAF